jgi:hypothetical protein
VTEKSDREETKKVSRLHQKNKNKNKKIRTFLNISSASGLLFLSG